MARAATKPRTPAVSIDRPKKRGRPFGSKNKVSVARDKATSAPGSKRVVKKRVAPVASKVSSADLEAQIAKLERSIVRIRKQNAELKLLASNGLGRVEQAESRKSMTRPAGKVLKTPASVSRGRRSEAGVAEKIVDDHGVIDQVDVETETGGHPS